MKRKMIMHPGDYAIGENEQLYMNMAEKGWILYKRGACFSWFRKEEAHKSLYRIEVASPAVLEENMELPEEQVALYEESGWKFVTRSGLVNVFTAPVGSAPVEFYSDPRQQADTLKALRRQYFFNWIPGAALFLFQLAMMVMVKGTGMGELISGFRIDYLENTAFWLMLGCLLVWAGCSFLHGAYRISGIYRRLKKGKYIDHAPGKKKYGYTVLSGCIGVCFAVMLVLTLVQQAGKTVSGIPDQAEGPYLLLGDLGLEGEHRGILQNKKSNYVEYSVSLLGEHWKVEESIQNESVHWMSQDVYQVESGEYAAALARDLMEASVFAEGEEEFQKAEIPGLDAVYYTEMEFVAVKGKRVSHMVFPDTMSQSGEGNVQGRQALLARMAMIL